MSYSISFNNCDDCDNNSVEFHKNPDNSRGFDANSSKWKIIEVDSINDINPGTFSIKKLNSTSGYQWANAGSINISIKDFSGENYSQWLSTINKDDRLMIRSVKNAADVGIYIVKNANILPSEVCSIEVTFVLDGTNIYPTVNDEYYISHLPVNKMSSSTLSPIKA